MAIAELLTPVTDNAVGVVLCSVAGYVAWTVLYNVFLHPLANVPGPLAGRLSGWPSFLHALGGKRHLWQLELFRKYGPRVRIAPDTVLFCKPEAYADIYNHKANLQRSLFYKAWQKEEAEVNTFTTLDRREHAQKRKRLNQAFTDTSLKSSEPLMIHHIERWTTLLLHEMSTKDDGWSLSMNFSEVSDRLIFDVMGDLCFGAKFNTKEPGDNELRRVPHEIVQYMQFFYPLTRSPFLKSLVWLKTHGLDYILKQLAPTHIRNYEAFVDQCLEQRLQRYRQEQIGKITEDRRDMLWYLCDSKDENGNPAYTRSELFAEASLLIVAGMDTTSVTLAGFVFFITRNRVQYDKLVAEIRSTFQTSAEILQGPKLASCRYLRACIDETMRLAPSGPSELPREVLKGGASIDGAYYPEGTIVGSCGWATGHNEKVYHDVEHFRPERWIADANEAGSDPEQVNALRANFHPFSRGPGACPGKNIAMQELSLTIAKMLFSLDVRTPPDHKNAGKSDTEQGKETFHLLDAYISVRDGPMVQFRARHSGRDP